MFYLKTLFHIMEKKLFIRHLPIHFSLLDSSDENVFNIDVYNPWKYKYVPDKGRVPIPTITKRTLSCASFFTGKYY